MIPDASHRLSASLVAVLLPLAMLIAGCFSTGTSGEGSGDRTDGIALLRSRSIENYDVTRARQLFIRGMAAAQFDDHTSALKLYWAATDLVGPEAAILSAMAESYDATGDLTTAIYHASEAVRLDSMNVHYRRQLAELHLKGGETSNAADTYEALLHRFPNNIEALTRLAEIQTASQEYREAIDTYWQVAELVGPVSDVLHRILRLYARLDDPVGMEETLLLLRDVDSDDPSLVRMLAELYTRQQRTGEALQLLETAYRDQPESFELLFDLANTYRARGLDRRADSLIEAAVARDCADLGPDELADRAHAFIVRLENTPGARDAALQMLERALHLSPEHPDALKFLGRLHYQEARFDVAGPLLYRALEQNPAQPDLWHESAAAFLQAGMPDRAVEVANEGLLLFPGRGELLQIAAYGLMDTYRNEEALARFDEALRVLSESSSTDGPLEADLLASMALIYTRLDAYTLSDSLYDRAIAADPSNSVALNNYAFSLAGRGVRLQEALDLARRAADAEPDNPAYLDTLGWVFFKLGRLEEARDWIGRAVETGRASSAVFEHLGDVNASLGDLDTAHALWRRALDGRPDDPGLQAKLRDAIPSATLPR